MKAKKLKLGDLVSYKGNSIVKIVELKEGDCKFLHVDEDYTFIGGVCHVELIPITEAILEQNGWVHSSDGYVLCWNQIQRVESTNIWTISRAGTSLGDIKYIHELQHILWVLGFDDDLKLPPH